VFSLSARGPSRGRCKGTPEPGVFRSDGERRVHLWRFSCTNVAWEAWCAVGIGLRRAIFWHSSVMGLRWFHWIHYRGQ
jgi:hypothetical protein